MNIAVIEGFLEGPLHSRRLKQALIKHGHEITTPETADCIIVHSGGWVFLPTSLDSKKIIFWDPAYKTEKPFTRRFISRLAYDFGHLRARMVIERLLNIWYLLVRPMRWVLLLRQIYRQPIEPLFTRQNSFVIGVGDRSWWSSPTVAATGVPHKCKKGDHDIFWSRPELILPYLV